jgi:hypothetical protein
MVPRFCSSWQGGAGYYEGDFFYVNWDIDLPQFKNYRINIKETMAIVLSVIADKSILAFLLFTFDKLSIKRVAKFLPPLTIWHDQLSFPHSDCQ